jgi:hypothetical protein
VAEVLLTVSTAKAFNCGIVEFNRHAGAFNDLIVEFDGPFNSRLFATAAFQPVISFLTVANETQRGDTSVNFRMSDLISGCVWSKVPR